MHRRARTVRWSVLLAGALAAGGGGALVALAGPLDPPAGPVTGTYKTLAEVEPRIAVNAANTPGTATALFRIIQPGSYYLIGNITGAPGKAGIEITAGGVTLDLMGFDLAGVPGALEGIRTTHVDNVAVLNGSVRDWPSTCVDLDLATNCRLTDLRVRASGANGIRTGSNAVVTGCSAASNAISGIYTLNCCTVRDCTASDNLHGIFAGSASTITNCVVARCAAAGIDGTNGSTISHCSSTDNAGEGFHLTNTCTITDCQASYNAGDGIHASSDSLIRGNTCATNGLISGASAGIRIVGRGNRIEGNTCTAGDRGIQADFAGNIIVRNTCSGNALNWTVVAGNICLVVTAAPSAAITGDSGGVGPGSADPNANFTY